MNREIKFKAKRKDNNSWIFGNLVYIKYADKYYIVDFNTNVYNENKFGNIKEIDIIEVIPETVCQYLGSINDIDLYENDIIKGFEDLYGNEVQGKVLLSFENGLQSHCEYNIYHFDYIYDFEVIGNIFDNPELLDKEVK